MMRKFLCPSILLAALMVVSAPTITQAQITAPGPYYAVPSWDQTFPAATRFVILSNMNGEAVLDRETGLVWERNPTTKGGGGHLFGANLACLQTEVGGRRGWRLPSVAELQTLYINHALVTGHPFDLTLIADSTVWTATFANHAFTPNLVHIVHLPSGSIYQVESFTVQPSRVWCVRGQGGQ